MTDQEMLILHRMFLLQMCSDILNNCKSISQARKVFTTETLRTASQYNYIIKELS